MSKNKLHETRPKKEDLVKIALKFNLDKEQNKYSESIRKKLMVTIDSPSGTGKTTIPVYMAIQGLLNGTYERFIYIRFVDDRYLKQGFHAGTLDEKQAGLFTPLMDAMYSIGMTKLQIEKLVKEEKIIMTTDTTIRGCNWSNAFVLIDEGQNARNGGDIITVISRIHDEGGKVVLAGHSGQCDNKTMELSPKQKLIPFQVAIRHFNKLECCVNCELKNNYRGLLSQHADKYWETYNEL